MVATLFGVSEVAVYQLQKEGVIPAPVDGAFDAKVCIQAYITYLKNDRGVVSAKELAKLMGVTVANVNRLVREDGMPRLKRGRYEISTCIQWYVERFRSKSMRVETNSVSEEQLLAKRAERKIKEAQLAKIQGDIVPKDECLDGWITLAGVFVSALESVPGRVSAVITSCKTPGEARQVLKSETKKIREIVSAQVRELTDSVSGEDSQDH